MLMATPGGRVIRTRGPRDSGTEVPNQVSAETARANDHAESRDGSNVWFTLACAVANKIQISCVIPFIKPHIINGFPTLANLAHSS